MARQPPPDRLICVPTAESASPSKEEFWKCFRMNRVNDGTKEIFTPDEENEVFALFHGLSLRYFWNLIIPDPDDCLESVSPLSQSLQAAVKRYAINERALRWDDHQRPNDNEISTLKFARLVGSQMARDARENGYEDDVKQELEGMLETPGFLEHYGWDY